MALVLAQLNEATVARGFNAEPENGPLHGALVAELGDAYVDPAVLESLRQAYGVETVTDLLGVQGDGYAKQLREALLQKGALAKMRYADERRNPDFKWSDTQEAIQDWMAQALMAATGVSHDEAMNYAFSPTRKGWEIEEYTADIVAKMNYFGAERLKRLATVTGIYGLDAYSMEQLERMVAFTDNPEASAEQLEHHDVSVAMVNRFGDYSGVLQGTAADFDDTAGRTLFFEITSMADIYRHMINLRKAGIRPATLLLAAHSGEGQFHVSDKRFSSAEQRRADFAGVAGPALIASIVKKENDKQPGVTGYSMHGMSGLARVVEEYMQPSRAIDDDAADLGRKKIIFSACYAGKETAVKDINVAGETYQIGIDSVVSRLGKDLLASGIKTNIDIYGAPDGMQMHRTERGLRYSGQPVDLEHGRTPLHAVRVRVEAGDIATNAIDEIVLRKVSS